MQRIEPGALGRFTMVVETQHLASAMGNTGVDVLATPTIAWLFECAATEALRPAMGPGELSVGTEICVRHLRPTPPGVRVTTVVTLREARGRRFFFEAVVDDEVERVAEGHIERAILEAGRFWKAVDVKRRPVTA